MGKILKEFARNNFYTNIQNEKRSPEREKLCDQIFTMQTELEEKLNNEEKKLLNHLIDTISDENSCYAQEKFIRGYCLGVLMTMEILSEQEICFRTED